MVRGELKEEEETCSLSLSLSRSSCLSKRNETKREKEKIETTGEMPGGDRPRGRGKDADYGVSNNHADCIFLLSLSIFLSLSAYLSAFTRSVTRKPMDLSCFLARLHLPPLEHPWRKNFKKSRKEITENRIFYFCFIGKKGGGKKRRRTSNSVSSIIFL